MTINQALFATSVALGALYISSEANAANFFKHPGRWFKETNRAAINVGKAVEKGAQDAGKAIEKGAQDTGVTIEKAAHDGGRAFEKAGQDTGRALEKAAHDTGHFVEEHPWEVIAAATFLVGGYYLIVYQQYTLAVTIGTKTIPLVQGGVWVGGASIGLGAGTLTYAALTPSVGSDDNAEKGTSGHTTITTTVGASQPRPTFTAPLPVVAGYSKAPELSFAPLKNRTPTDARFQYAYDVMKWLDSTKAVQNFDPKVYPDRLSPAEVKILDALQQVSRISDSKADKLALNQAKLREDLPRKLYQDACKDIILLKGPDAVAKHALKTILKVAIEPTIPGDGTRAARDRTSRLLVERLTPFLDKRVDKQPGVQIDKVENVPTLRNESRPLLELPQSVLP